MDLSMIDDQIIPFAELDKSRLDRGVFFGDGVYEVVRSYDGKIFALPEHLRRFKRSLREIGIEEVDIDVIEKRVREAYEESKLDNARIYFHITRGCEPRNHVPSDDIEPSFFMTVNRLVDPQKIPSISVSTHPDWRWKRCDIKSLNLLANVLARIDAKKRGSDEAILVDETGDITEGAGSAFFVIDSVERTLITRPLGAEILPSITRQIIVGISERAGLEVIERTITPTQASHSHEAFIAVTTKDIVPVVKFDGLPVADGRAGEYTLKLKKLFREEVDARMK